MEGEEEDQVAIPPISKTLSTLIIPITPDKKTTVRPPRKTISRKRALPIGGRGRGRRGSMREESPHKSDEEKQDMAGSKGVYDKKSGEQSSHLDEPVGAGERRVLRRSGRGRKIDDTSPDNDKYVPKRRLILDEGGVSSSQDADGAPTAAEPSGRRTSARVTRKRKSQERYDSYSYCTLK